MLVGMDHSEGSGVDRNIQELGMGGVGLGWEGVGLRLL